ncbi:MAG: sugar ABC transporter substrate-binding protein [Cryobacterium sp.]
MRKIHTAALGVAAVAILALTACSSGDGTPAADGADKDLTIIALLPQGYDQPYGSVYVDTMMSTAEEMGVTLELTNAKYDASKQASECDVAVAKKPDGIILWPADASAVRPCLLKAQAAGIPVNSSNSDVIAADKDLVYSYSGPSNDEVGRLDADLLNTALGGVGNIVIIQGQPGNSTATDRQTGFESQLAAEYPGLTVIGAQPANWDKAQAITATSELLTRLGDQIDGIYAQDDTMAAGAIDALTNRGIDPSTLAIVGTGNTDLGQANVLAGKQYGTLFQSPIWDGRTAIEQIIKVINGEEVEENLYMPMPLVTIENAADYPAEW